MKASIALPISSDFLRTSKTRAELMYPQKPLVTTILGEALGSEMQCTGFNGVVATMAWCGFNVEDALIINEGSIQRGLGVSQHFKLYKDSYSAKGSPSHRPCYGKNLRFFRIRLHVICEIHNSF